MRVNVRTILSTKCAVRMCEILVAMGAFALRETRKYLRIRENMTSLVLDFGEPHTYVSPEHEADTSKLCLVHWRRKETLLDVCCVFQCPFDHALLLLDAMEEAVNQIRAIIENVWRSLLVPPDIEKF